jgi:SsrA-binding protein
MKIITTNKSASFEYFIEDKYEAGIELEGNEVKSLRLGNVNMNDSFCFVVSGEAFVKNIHIAFVLNGFADWLYT